MVYVIRNANIDPAEVAKFAAHSGQWWDPDGPLKTLHVINPIRVDYMERQSALAGKRVLDAGCGAGLLCEAAARRGATVTGLDAASDLILAARTHATSSSLAIEYVQGTVEEFAAQRSGGFDVVSCMELLEHVPEPAALVAGCARLVKPGGDVFFSTINRTLAAYVLAVLGGEYLLRLLPRGTHDYARLIRPSELAAWARRAGLMVADITGISYWPFPPRAALSGNVAVNYLMHTKRAQD
jgi:2-polyprenyl-6-hydroxyphenyl methylase/3-demethylubiquinone-9 3-methyltransferase